MGQISISNFSNLLHRSRWGWKRVPLFPPRWKKCYVHVKTKIQRYIIRMIITEPISLWLGVTDVRIPALLPVLQELVHCFMHSDGASVMRANGELSGGHTGAGVPFSMQPLSSLWANHLTLMPVSFSVQQDWWDLFTNCIKVTMKMSGFFKQGLQTFVLQKTSERTRRTQLWVLSDSSCFK